MAQSTTEIKQAIADQVNYKLPLTVSNQFLAVNVKDFLGKILQEDSYILPYGYLEEYSEYNYIRLDDLIAKLIKDDNTRFINTAIKLAIAVNSEEFNIHFNEFNLLAKFCYNRIDQDKFVQLMMPRYNDRNYIITKWDEFRNDPLRFIISRSERELFDEISREIIMTKYKG